MIDYSKIEKDFPVLKERMRGKKLSYLDSAASALIPKCVAEAVSDYMMSNGTNIHRSVYELGEKATERYENVRKKTADFLNAKSEKEIIFTKGTTEAINLVAYSWGRANVAEGDVIIVNENEHHANLIPWQELAKERGAELRFIPLRREDGTLNVENLDSLFDERVKLLAVSMVSNVTGQIHPVEKIIATAHKHGVKVLLDAAQSAPHMKVDVQKLDADFLAFSAHKLGAPSGVGVLFGKEDILEEMPPFLYGGSMILKVYKDRASYLGSPEKFEPGTANISGVIGLGAALDYLEGLGLDAVHEHEQELLRTAYEKLSTIDGVRLFGSNNLSNRAGIVSFATGGLHPHDMGAVMDSEGVAVRVGHHCCQPLMRLWGVPGTARASFYYYNNEEDIDALVRGIEKLREVFNGF